MKKIVIKSIYTLRNSQWNKEGLYTVRKITREGKIPRDEKPVGFLVMGEPLLFEPKKYVFHKGMLFSSGADFKFHQRHN